jgi:hypothetical protein
MARITGVRSKGAHSDILILLTENGYLGFLCLIISMKIAVKRVVGKMGLPFIAMVIATGITSVVCNGILESPPVS